MARPGNAPRTEAPPPAPERRSSWLWTALKLLVGALLYALAALLVFIVIEHALSRAAAVVAVVLTSVLAPLALAQLLTPAFRKLDASTTFFGVLPGVAGLCAIVTLVALPLSAKGPVSRALDGLAARYPTAPKPATNAARALGHALDPSVADAGMRDAGLRDAGLRDAATVAARDTSADVSVTSDVSDASDANDVSDASDASDANDASDASDGEDGDDAVDAAAPPGDPAMLAEVESPCAPVRSIVVADLEGDARDEIVVQCAESLHVFALTEGTLTERLRVVASAPAQLEGAFGPPAVFDMDGDGRRDIIACEHFTTERGGGRGGVTRYVTNRGDGRFGSFVELDRLDGCGAVTVADVTGDGREELLVAHTGNPYLATLPQGDLAWFSHVGRQWTRRGRFSVGRWPARVVVRDVNADGVGDAIVEHDWETTSFMVLPGSRAGLRAADPALHAPELPSTQRAEGRFDLDDTADTVDVARAPWAEHYTLRLSRSQRSDAPTITAITGTPMILPPPSDAGTSADAATHDAAHTPDAT